MADQLATPEDLASLLERDDIDRYKAIALIECATSVVQAITGQRIVEVVDEAYTVELDQLDRGRRFIDLPERPVTAVSAVSISGNPLTDWTLSMGRLWRPYGWVLPRQGAWANMPYHVQVTYSHGYPSGHQNLQLARQAVLGLLKTAYGNPTGATRILIDDYEIWFEAMSARLEASPFLVGALKRRYSRPPRSAVLTR